MESKRLMCEIERLYTTFSSVYDVCQKRKVLLEAISADTRHLLQPWPKKKKVEKSVVTLEHSTAQVIPPKDEADLSLVENALAKAERTRNRYLEKALKQKESVPAVISSVSGVCNQSSEKSDTNHNISHSQKCGVAETNSKSLAGGKTGKPVKGQKTDITQRSEVTRKSGKTRAGSEFDQKADANIGHSEVGVISQGSLSRLLANDQKKSKSVCSSKKQTPVYAKAPFKTDPVVQRPRSNVRPRQGQHASASIKSQIRSGKVSSGARITDRSGSSNRSLINGTGNRGSSKRHTGLEQSSKSSCIEQQTNNRTQMVNDLLVKPEVTEGLSGAKLCEHLDQSVTKSSDVQDAEGNLVCNFDRLHIQQPASMTQEHMGETIKQSGQNDDRDQVDDGDRFLLVTHGKQLSLPTKVSKLLAQNRRLRQKLKASLITKSMHLDATPAEEFMEQLQEHIDENAGFLHKYLSLVSLYSLLMQLLDKINPTDVSDYSWKEILWYKHQLGIVLSYFSEASQLQTRLLHGSTYIPSESLPSPISTPLPPHQNSTYWLPGHLDTVGYRAPACLRYSVRRQLIDYTSLVHRKQQLGLQLSVLSRLDGLMDEVYSHAEDTRSLYAVYRGLYGLVCISGRGFPALVQDNIAELDSEHSNIDNDF